jgi:hypothetical protein
MGVIADKVAIACEGAPMINWKIKKSHGKRQGGMESGNEWIEF